MTAQTIFALSSGRPPAGIGVIRVSGPEAHSGAMKLAVSLPPVRHALVRELRDPRTGEKLDQAIVLRFDGPASATGEDIVEFHCHGGRAVLDAVLGALRTVSGLREAEPGEFTRRAFANGRVDLTEAEGLADLLEAETQSQRRAALKVAEGGLRRQIAQWQEQLLALSAAAELAIDYDEDDQPLDPGVLAGCAVLADELEGWLTWPRAEPLKNGVRVVVAGPPNAGKSSLINAIADAEHAIVTDVPGTTRDIIEVHLSLSGIPMVLTDTAGLRDADDPVEAIGIEKAQRAVESCDILVWLGEPADRPAHTHAIQVSPKSDLGLCFTDAQPVSATTREGLGDLMKLLASQARGLLPSEDAIALNRRQAELVEEASQSLREAETETDLPIMAEHLRRARLSFDRLTGRAGIEDVLDTLFGRFCLGK